MWTATKLASLDLETWAGINGRPRAVTMRSNGPKAGGSPKTRRNLELLNAAHLPVVEQSGIDGDGFEASDELDDALASSL
ncbi:uncharacterized protein LTR77_000256 [Saxophila tyrrhenica]|uniref:Uncharacterized protein n=1 Tax=Saxophila tyrrhenica TaxID=1690608 RepID=A0AAV9PPZ9_9PEZI|nr:hypothetical protein LTR77_000256 [Saxophila tyrrhenica]